MSLDAVTIVVAVALAAAVVVAVVRFEARRVNQRLDRIMTATGIAEPRLGARNPALAHESALGTGESRSMRDSEALTPAERRNEHEFEVERSLAALAGLRAEREPDS